MLVDANLLLYAIDSTSTHHERAADWLVEQLNGHRMVGIPWTTIGAVLRIATNPRILATAHPPATITRYVDGWLARPNVWIPPATERTAAILTGLATRDGATGNLVPDAMLAALAIEHGLTVKTADTDFGRFPDVTWENPLLSGS